MLHLLVLCAVTWIGGRWWSRSRQPTLPHSQSGPIINTQVLTGGSRSCNTTAISGLRNGGWEGRGEEGERRMGEEGAIEEGGEGVDCPLSCSWLLQSRQVLWSLPSQQATTPNTKVSANGTPSLSERATWFLVLFHTRWGSNKQAFGHWALMGLSALCICSLPLVPNQLIN